MKLKDSIRNYALIGTTVFFRFLMMLFFAFASLISVAVLLFMLFTDLKMPQGAVIVLGVLWTLPFVSWGIMSWSSRQPIALDPKYADETKIYVIEGRRIS